VVSIWVHGGFLQLSGQKIAKSKKNVVLVPEIVERGLDPLSFRLLCFGTQYRSEMDFSWEALEAVNTRLLHLRQRMADWAGETDGAELSPAAREFDDRFRDAVANDLGLPQALVILNEAATSSLPGPERYALFSSWDQVLGLDLERLAREGFDIPAEVQALVDQRDAARQAKDFATSDDIRSRLIEMGYEVMDTAEGTKVRPRA
jgi:cysteinyl-tRNA synthetase